MEARQLLKGKGANVVLQLREALTAAPKLAVGLQERLFFGRGVQWKQQDGWELGQQR